MRLKSAWASAMSDQSRCLKEESLGPKLHIERTAKTLIRLGTHSFYWFCRVVTHMKK